MPLTFASKGEEVTIVKVGGKEDSRKFLENLGFTTDSRITVVSETAGNLIVNVRDSRVAIGREMANKIQVA